MVARKTNDGILLERSLCSPNDYCFPVLRSARPVCGGTVGCRNLSSSLSEDKLAGGGMSADLSKKSRAEAVQLFRWKNTLSKSCFFCSYYAVSTTLFGQLGKTASFRPPVRPDITALVDWA